VGIRRKLVVVSNRGPLVYGRSAGRRVARRGGGGLVTALSGLSASHDLTWIAAAMTDEDRRAARGARGALEETDAAGNPFRLRLVRLDRGDYDRYYNVFANPLLWFLQHGLWSHPYAPEIGPGTRAAWDSYRRVNEAFAVAAAEEATDAEAILVHDYQLYLLPRLLRNAGYTRALSHFTHIPWPGPDAWRVLTEDMREQLVLGLLGANVVGFHTIRAVRAFLFTVEEYVGEAFVDHARQRISLHGDVAHARHYPISVDPAAFEALARSEAVVREENELRRQRPERLLLRVDRTDPSKNIVRGFHAFDRLLVRHPEWRRRVRMLALLDPSRQSIPEYAEYLAAVQRAAREVNDQYARDGWIPIDLRVHDNFHQAVAAYKQFDVLLVNAIVDGMNLIAKEAPLVNERDGVLVLSENAGAHEELGAFALSVNPFDVEGTADAIAEALEMPAEERAARAAAIREQVRTHDVHRWLDTQLADLDEVMAGAAR
jgi:trehalose 6-phosphate synthase